MDVGAPIQVQSSGVDKIIIKKKCEIPNVS